MKELTNKAAKKREKKARREQAGLPVVANPPPVDWMAYWRSKDATTTPVLARPKSDSKSRSAGDEYKPATYGEFRPGDLVSLRNELDKLGFYPKSSLKPAVSEGIESFIRKLQGNDDIQLPSLPRRLPLFESRLRNSIPTEPRISLLLRLLIRQHANVLQRKRQVLRRVDEYGLVDDSKWINEKRQYVTKVICTTLREEIGCSAGQMDTLFWGLGLRPLSELTFEILSTYIETVVDHADSRSEPVHVDNGHAYEHFVAGLFKKVGISASVTKGSGDDGADLVLKTSDGETLVVQCKWYSAPVGNKAVQEVYSAKDIYNADQAWVVTNSTYTVAAKAAANKLGVLLIHHDEIQTLFAVA